MRTARKKVHCLPADFRYHDLRRYLASLLIASGADVKTVQARPRQASAKTTLDTHRHIWPDRDEPTPRRRRRRHHRPGGTGPEQ
jgi:integrase